jgi:hypothetical protein
MPPRLPAPVVAFFVHLSATSLLSRLVKATTPETSSSCFNNSAWGPCKENNIGFRHPKYDTVHADQVDENGVRVLIDGDLGDWGEHPDSKR